MKTKQELIAARNKATDPEFKAALRSAIKQVENLESTIKEIDALVKAIQRIIREAL